MAVNYFTMKKQCEQEYLEVHDKCFKKAIEANGKYELVYLKGINKENLRFRDRSFGFKKVGEEALVEGHLECKYDSWRSPYMVSELLGSISMAHIGEDAMSDFFGRRLLPGSEEYESMWFIVKDIIDNDIDEYGKKRGYGLSFDKDLGLNAFFSYYNRVLERKRIDGRSFITGKVLSRKWYVWKGKYVRDFTLECFLDKKHCLQVAPNVDKRTGAKWCSINQLLPYGDMKPEAKGYFELEEDDVS